MNIYAVYDKVENRFYTVFLSETDCAAVRDNLMYLTRVKPLDDIEIHRLGAFDLSSGVVDRDFFQVPLDSYHFDESVMIDMKKPNAQREMELYTLRQKIAIEKSEVELQEQREKLDQLRMRGDVRQDK